MLPLIGMLRYGVLEHFVDFFEKMLVHIPHIRTQHTWDIGPLDQLDLHEIRLIWTIYQLSTTKVAVFLRQHPVDCQFCMKPSQFFACFFFKFPSAPTIWTHIIYIIYYIIYSL